MRSYIKIFALFITAITLTNCSSRYFTLQKETHNYTVDNNIAADSVIVNYYLPFKQQLESEMNRVIGYSETNLTRTRVEAESTAGNFFVEALLEIGKSIDSTAQISLATKFGIRADIKQGDITVGNVFELMPFENSITILELSGKDLQTLTHFIAKTGGQPIAGMTMQIKDNQPQEIYIQNQAFDVNKTYKLVTYDYLANGGDYIEGLDTPINRNDSGIIVRKGLIDYIEKLTTEGKTINTKLDGRVKIIK